MHRRSCNELPTALAIFATTLVFIFWRPRGIREMWFTVAGALAMYGAGLIDWDDAVQLGVETGSVLLFLAGMLVVGFVADNAGVFAWLARHAARWSAGSGHRLYIGIYAIGVFVTVWFSLDTTAVVLAPIVYSLVRSLGIPPLPFVFATTYVANTASLLLPVSNLTNLIVWNRFDIPFWHYARVMILPALLPVAVNLLLFLWLFRRDIPNRFEIPLQERAGDPAADDRRSHKDGSGEPGASADPGVPGDPASPGSPGLRRNVVLLAAILAAMAAAPFFGWELWIVAVVGGFVLAGFEFAHGQLRSRQLLSGISWDLLPFVFALFLILRGVGQSGLTEWTEGLLSRPDAGESFLHLLLVASTTALGSNVMNNLPMLLMAVDGLAAPLASGEVGMATVYAALIGANLGPNLTVIGSLATMLSLSIIGRRGLRVPGTTYLKIGLITVPLLLVASVFGLWLAFLW